MRAFAREFLPGSKHMNRYALTPSRHALPYKGRPESGSLGRIVLGTAVVLGVAAVANYVVAREMERRHPPAGQFVHVGGVRLHYTDRGEGPAVVLLHGNGATLDDFDISGVTERLARNHRVISFDRPGFGHSSRPHGRFWSAEAQAELIRKAMVRLGVDRAVVVGHSWGTLVALSLALNHPRQVAGLALLAGYYHPTVRGDVVPMSLAAVPVLGDIMRYTISPPLGWLIHKYVYRNLFKPAAVAPPFAEEFPLGLALRPSQLKASAADTALMISGAAANAPRYGELKMPVSIISGRDDQIVDFARQAERLHAEIPQSRLEAIDAAGHMIHHIAPERVAAAIDGAVRESQRLLAA